MKINFQNDTINAFGQNIPLVTTTSGHYAIPLTPAKQAINDLERESSSNITLTMNNINQQSNHAIAIKLHRQFAHPTSDKLIRLINNAGNPWCDNLELKNEIKSISKNCSTCKVYRKNPPRPVVGLAMATNFQETVAMDLKFCHGKILLHLIDQCTRLSASCTIPDKNPDTVIKAIFKIWISVYGSAEKFLTDNGGEFANSDFIELCESFGITVKTTAAESPWSNGLAERHNLVLSDMLDKILHDNNCDFGLAVAWAVNPKNSLSNIHGFSPYQLAIGTNPKLPSLHTAKAPAITTTPTNKIITRNSQALHKAREAFIASENSEKLKRALSHNIRTSGDTKYLTGDTFYF